MEITSLDIVLCEFYFSNLNQSKKRPVLVFKDNLPFDDFIAIPISSKIGNMTKYEILIELKNFENGSIPVKSKLILRKTFVVSKSAVIKKYGTVKEDFFKYTKKQFCKYFEC